MPWQSEISPRVFSYSLLSDVCSYMLAVNVFFVFWDVHVGCIVAINFSIHFVRGYLKIFHMATVFHTYQATGKSAQALLWQTGINPRDTMSAVAWHCLLCMCVCCSIALFAMHLCLL